MEEFIQKHVRYDKDIPSDAIMRTIAQKSRHSIIVSNIRNPREMQIQLSENFDQLNMLMDELEHIYVTSICSRSFNMPIEYVKFNKLCAAVYPNDENWHRCRIIGVNRDANWAKVNYLDYGGDAVVDLSQIKFLSTRCAQLPAQAVQAHFFNIRAPGSGTKPAPGKTPATWSSNSINYLLNLFLNKTLEAEVKGLNGDSVALEIFMKDQDSDGNEKWVNLNEVLVKDGYGEWHDEISEPPVSIICFLFCIFN